MKKIKTLLLFGLLHCCVGSLAQVQQIWGDPQVRQQYSNLAYQDPAYKKFRTELDKLMKTAKGSNTNYTAVKALIAQNKTVIDGLYKRSNVQSPSTGYVIKKKMPKAVRVNTNRLNLQGSTLQQTKTPAYQATWRWTDQGGGMTLPDTSLSQYTSGKSAFAFGPHNWNQPYRLGAYSQGSYHSFTVPSNPEIIEAEVRIEYSYLYAGWDTYGGRNGIELIVRANKDFVSSELKSLPLADQSHGYPANYSGGRQAGYNGSGNAAGVADSFRVVRVVVPRDTVNTDIKDWNEEENNGVFTVRGHVYPGNQVKFNFGIGYMVNTVRGSNSSYHYLECRVKKITVTFLKAGD